MGMKNTPFTNGIEVSAEVVERAAPAAADSRTALRLMTLLIEHMDVDAEAMERAAREGDITATALADVLVRKYGIAFRAAHDAVAKMVSSGASLQDILGIRIDPADVVLDPRAVVEAAVAGGGPAPASLARQLDTLRTSAASHLQRIRERRAKESAAAERLRKESDRILAEAK
jgi:argininosuccinate lyase